MATIIIIRQKPRTSESEAFYPAEPELFTDARLEAARDVIDELIVLRDSTKNP